MTAHPRVGVVGAEHLHLIQIVDALVGAGAVTVAHTSGGSLGELYSGWRTDSVATDLDGILDDDSIDVIVTAGVPAERAAVAVAAIEAGKAVVSAKPGVTTTGQLTDLRAVLAGRPGRPWTVVFTERLANRAVVAALAAVEHGAIGDVVRVRGVGPHTLAAEGRPDWFFDPGRSGGILVDLASHQVDQFLCIVGDAPGVRVLDASVGNVANPQHPWFCDVGGLTLVSGTVEGRHDVDLLSPAGLGTWGDVRLEIVGTTGTLEVRANIDVTGVDGAEHLILVDADGARRVDTSGVDVDWARVLLADLAAGTEELMTQDHVLRVAETTLAAQGLARRWGSGR